MKHNKRSIIQMTKESCVLCNGSGYVAPYPYHKRKKCDHKWNYDSFMYRFSDSLQKIKDAIQEHKKWKTALKASK
jgi:hypothetical protein